MRALALVPVLALCGLAPAGLASPAPSPVEPELPMTAVFSSVSSDYVRATLPNGKPVAETYGLGKGGYFRGGVRDVTIDEVKFEDVAHAIARPLAESGYVATNDPRKAKLLIMVYWGETLSRNYEIDPEDRTNFGSGTLTSREYSALPAEKDVPTIYSSGITELQNAMILGYADELAQSPARLGIIHNVKHDDLVDDIRHDRYFVVMLAYDFQALWKDKKRKILWETRFSVREQGNDFGKLLPSIARYAGQFFGEDSHGLIRTTIPRGNVEVGVPREIEAEQEQSESALVALAGNTAKGEAKPVALLPPEISGRIADYEKAKAAMQGDLAERLKDLPQGADTRGPIDAFNAENAKRIAELRREAEGIRGDLARYAASNTKPASAQSVDALIRQFSERIQGIEVGNPLYAQP